MTIFNDELHCGSDFIRRYVADGHVFTGATAVMKVRAENDIELVAAECTVDGDSVTVKIPGERSREIPRRYRMAKYDVFVTKENEYSYKLVMGDMRIIYDESLH
jgi:hypothetical protein